MDDFFKKLFESEDPRNEDQEEPSFDFKDFKKWFRESKKERINESKKKSQNKRPKE